MQVPTCVTVLGESLTSLESPTACQPVELAFLLQACGQETASGTSDEAVASVTTVFVSAFPDIPEHRRLPLFAKLTSTLGAADHLWVLVSQMAEQYVAKSLSSDAEEDPRVRTHMISFIKRQWLLATFITFADKDSVVR